MYHDEYDKPLLQTFHDKKLQENYRSTLMAFYTVLKDADPFLKFVFITGVTKFAQIGVFSTLNYLTDISLYMDYYALCGLTRSEMEATFAPELEQPTRPLPKSTTKVTSSPTPPIAAPS